MFRTNALKAKLRAGTPTVGVWAELADPMVTELLGQCGFDAVVVDNEHGPGDLKDTVGRLQALASTPASAVVRVPWNDPVYVKRMLDMGAESLMFPSVDGVEAARAAVEACFYPPRGRRGAAYGIVRAADYGLAVQDYLHRAADELLVICQIESAAAVEAIPDMARVPGVDMLFVGPYDLSGSIGKLARFDDPEVKALIARAERAIRDSGRWWGTIVFGGRSAADLRAEGCHFVVDGSDIAFLRDGALATRAAFDRAG